MRAVIETGGIVGQRSRASQSVVYRLVDGGPEVEVDREPRWLVRPLDHEDRRHVLGRVVVPGGAVLAVPSVAPDRGSEVRASGADRHPETPADVLEVPQPEPGDRLLRRRQVVARHQRHRGSREHALAAVGTAGEQGRGEGEQISGGRDEAAAT